MKPNPSQNIPTTKSNSTDWLEWYKELKSSLGRKEANAIFLKAWTLRGNNNSDLPLREELKKGGLAIEESALNKIVDKGAGALDFFGDIFKVGKWVGIGFAVILVGGLGLMVYNIAKNPVGAVKAIK